MAPEDSIPRVCLRCGAALEPQNSGGVCRKCASESAAATPGEDGTIVLSFADIPALGREEFPAIGGYEILELIARGGMGVVYKAREQKLKRIVALKTVLGGTYASNDFKRRFRREAQMAARLHHPNIVPIFEVGEYAGQPYFSMEYVEGTDLDKMTHQQPLRPEEAARYVQAVAEGVHYAHTQGVLHRDLKPSNILVGSDDRPRITDFGLARDLGGDSTLTSTGALLGSPGYLPPEQVSAGRGEIGPASDVYGLGAVLYHLLTGRPPYVASTVPDTLKQLLETEPVAPRKLNLAVPADLELICLKCLRKKQKERYQSALELAEDLQRYIDSQPVKARMSGLASPLGWEWTDEPAKPKSSPASVFWLLLLVAVITVVCWKNWEVIHPYATAVRNWVAGKPPPTPETTPPNQPDSTVSSNSANPWTASGTNPPGLSVQSSPPLGTLIVHLVEYPKSARAATDFRCVIRSDGMDKPIENFLKADQIEVKLPPGGYQVSLALPDDPSWVLHSPVQVKAGETSRLELRFKFAEMSLISDPPGANVSWPSWAAPTGLPPPQTTPFTHRFRSGAIPFTVTMRGYFVSVVTNHFYPATDNAAQNQFRIVLRPRPLPHAEQQWTNSLGMVFQWVKSQQLWACETEARVRDFRAYVSENAARYDSSLGMTCITSNGMEQLNCSWENPGPAFSQTEEHPVVGVNWKDATDFCQWLSDHERKLGHLLSDQCYRLPSTKEWIALAGGQRFPWGRDLEPVGNYAGDEVPGPYWPAPWPILFGHRDSFARTAPVYCPDFKPNPLGFYHLGGNVAEWCAEKVVLGGSWFDGEFEDLPHLQTVPLNTDLDAPVNPDERNDRNGFRVVLEDIPWTQARAREAP